MAQFFIRDQHCHLGLMAPHSKEDISFSFSDIILPALTWHAGKKAAAVRTAASSSLWSLAESELLKPGKFCRV